MGTFDKEAIRLCREIYRHPRNNALLTSTYQHLSSGSPEDVASLFETIRADAEAVMGLLLVRRSSADELATLAEYCQSKLDDSILDDLTHWHENSSSECIARLESMGAKQHFVSLELQQVMVDGVDALDIRLIQNVPTSQVPTCLWDIRTIKTDLTAELAYLMCTLNESMIYRKGRARSFNPGPLYHLHPERFRESRAYLKSALNLIEKLDRENRLSTELERANQPILVAMQKESLDYPLRSKLSDPTPPAVHFSREFEITWFLYKFVGAGRQIFSLSSELVEMFRNTSVDDIPVGELVSPYECYYVHFGPQADLQVGSGWSIDGAYVEHIPELNLLQFGFTAMPDDARAALDWHSRMEPWKILALRDQSSQSLGSAIDALITEKRAEIEEKISKGDRDITADIQAVADEAGYENPYEKLVDISEKSGKLQLTEFERNLPAFQKALEIVVNAMCYLTAYRDDIRQRWPEGTPEKLAVRAKTGTPSQRRRSISKLYSLGYTKVHFCGDFAASTQEGAEASRSVRTHWRRGHWRSQPYGPGRNLRKMVLIRPILVNAESEASEGPLGHIYIGEHVPSENDTVH